MRKSKFLRNLLNAHPRYFHSDPDATIIRQAEEICKIVSQMEELRNLDSSLKAANFNDLPPSLVLQVLKKLNNAGTMALSFFRWAEKQRNFQRDPECYNALIQSLGKIKQFKMVWVLVDEMNYNGLLSKDTFSLVSRGFAKAKKVEEAIESLERMEVRYGFKPDVEEFNSLLHSICKSRHVEIAQEVFDKWSNRRFTPNVKSYTILLEGWTQKCNFMRLDEICYQMKGEGFQLDIVSYGILINAYCKANRFDEAIKLLHQMNAESIKATPHIYCTFISCLGSAQNLNQAVEVFNLCKSSNCVMDAPTYNAMVGAYCWSKRFSNAYGVVNEMKQCGIGPDARTYDIILHHLIKGGKFEEACSLFQKMMDESGVVPTIRTYEIMLRMFCSEEHMDMALKIWDQMKSSGVLPGMPMFSALINGLCTANRLNEAYKYIQEMMDMGIRPPGTLIKTLKEALLVEGKEGTVIVFDHKISKLRNSPLFG